MRLWFEELPETQKQHSKLIVALILLKVFPDYWIDIKCTISQPSPNQLAIFTQFILDFLDRANWILNQKNTL